METVSPADMAQAIRIGHLVLTLIPLAVFIQVALAIWNSRRKPSIPEELYRDYATKRELAELRADFSKSMSDFFTRQHLNQSAIEDKFNAILRSVGQIEGQLQKCPNICK